VLGVGATGLLAAGLVSSSPPVTAQTDGSLSTQDISLAQAQAVVDAAIAAANNLGAPMDIAVIDVGAYLEAFARMGGA
jgi:hypothetical protein